MSGTIPKKPFWRMARIQPRGNRLGFREKLDRQFDGREALSRIGKPEIKFFEIFF